MILSKMILVLIFNLFSTLALNFFALSSYTPNQMKKSENSIECKNFLSTFCIKKHESGVIYLKRLSLNYQKGLIKLPDPGLSKNKICPLWQIDLNMPQLNFNSNSATFIEWIIKENKNYVEITLDWTKEFSSIVFDIKVCIKLEKSSSRTLWNLYIFSKDNKYFSVRRCVFPIIGDFIHSSEDELIKLAVPAYWGREYQKAENCDYLGIYPSATAAMQFLAYYNSRTGDGIYISTNDSKGYYKIFSNHKANPQYPYARAEISVFPENLLVNTWVNPITIEVRSFSGNWYEAAKFYRNWAIENAPWSKPNRVKSSERLYNNILWQRIKLKEVQKDNFNDTKFLENLNNLNNYFKVPSAIHLYNWHFYPFDNMYPKYFPAIDGFTNLTKKMKEMDFLITPYINGRIVDVKVVEQDDSLKENACIYSLNSDEKFKMISYSGNKFLTMCPSSNYWKKTLSIIIDKLVRDYEINSVYLDQIGNDAPTKCVSYKHGHTPDPDDKFYYSSGNHWVTGYRDILSNIKNNPLLSPNFFLMTENNAEPWNDLISAFLMIEYRVREPWKGYEIIPLYPAVYSGFTTTIGFSYLNPPIDKYLNVLLYKFSLNLIWGSQIGRIEPDLYNNGGIIQEYIKKLSYLRQIMIKYFNYGEMLFEPQICGMNKKILIDEMIPDDNFNYKSIQFSENPILGTFWRLNSDSGAVFLTNYSNMDFKERQVKLRLNLFRYGLTQGTYSINQITKDNILTKVMEVKDAEVIIPISILPYDVLAYEFVHLN